MKKIMLLLTVLLSIFTLAACGEEDDGRIEITVGMWPQPYLSEDVEMFEEWKRLFEADYPEYEIVPDPYTYSVDTFFPMAQSGTQPTIFQTWFTEPAKLIRNQFVRDISDEMEELGWYDKMDPYMKETLTFDGELYGVPRDAYGLGLVLNLNVLAEAGIVDDWDGDGVYDIHDADGNPRYPTTFEELADMSENITNTMDQYYDRDVAGMMVLSSNNNGGWQFSNMAWNFGAELQVQDSNGNWQANLDDPGAVATLEWIKEMRWEREALPESSSLSYGDWYNYIGTDRVAMAIAGNDALALPVTNFGMDKDNLAFVPIPEGPGGEQYSLFGGTPYMFSSHASDEQVLGALRFLEYMGRSPETTDISEQSMTLGRRTAEAKGMPILPELNPWDGEEYEAMVNRVDQQFINVNMDNFDPFYNSIESIRKTEAPHYSQEMYEILDSVIQQVLTNPDANPSALLSSANNTFQTQYMNDVND